MATKEPKKPKAGTKQVLPVAEASAPAKLEILPTAAIAESKSNPRTQFDQAAIDELAQSIGQVGVIQPIVVRPDADGFEIVCGARRYRAAKQAGLTEIPAVIRTLTDDEAFDLAITENLQRKDVNPLDEAVALLKMKERGYSTKEQAAKLGKSESYVVQRLKLNDLIEPLKQALFAGKLLVSHANQLARISAGDQQYVYEENLKGKIEQDDFEPRTIFGLDSTISRTQRKLTAAPFDITDASLVPDAGACANCPKNTACATLLFPDMDPGQARCTDSECWGKKEQAELHKVVERVKENPEQVFLVSKYGRNITTPAKRVADVVKAAGLDINNFLDITQFEIIEKPDEPDEPDADDYTFDPNEDGWQQYDSQDEADEALAEARREYQADLEKYRAEMRDYEQAISGNSHLWGLVVEGSDCGTLIPIRLKGKTAAAIATATGNSAAVEASIQQQIADIEKREARAKELDQEKIHAELVEIFETNPVLDPGNYQTFSTGLDTETMRTLCYYLYEQKEWTDRKLIAQFMGIDEEYPDNEAIWNCILEFNPEYLPTVLDFLTHRVIFAKFKSHLPQHAQGKVLRYLINHNTPPSKIEAVEAPYNEKAQARAARVAQRIAELKAKAQ